MGTLIDEELELIKRYSSGCKFIIETGGGGKSTEYLAHSAWSSGGIFVSIEADRNRKVFIDKKLEDVIDYKYGWSVNFDDIIKQDDPLFVKSRYNTIDEKIAFGDEHYMIGEKDVIRKSLKEYNEHLDFFFCDTGEYCGLAEWNVVKDKIVEGGYFSCHDIYYPKSIKCFQVCREIENSKDWHVLVKTKSKQGLLIAQKKI